MTTVNEVRTSLRGRLAGQRKNIAGRIGPFLVPIVAVLIWQIATMFVSAHALPTPLQTWNEVVRGVSSGQLTGALWATLRVVLQAFLLAAVAGLAFSAWLGSRPFWAGVFADPLVWLYSIPKITLFPIFLLVFGLGTGSRMAFGAVHGFFPIAIIALAGIRAVPVVYLRSAKVLGLSKLQTIFQVVFPASLPSILAGLRFGFSFSFLGVVLAEMFGSSEGAGYELIRLISLNNLPGIFAVALSLTAIAFFINLILTWVERQFSQRGRSNL